MYGRSLLQTVRGHAPAGTRCKPVRVAVPVLKISGRRRTVQRSLVVRHASDDSDDDQHAKDTKDAKDSRNSLDATNSNAGPSSVAISTQLGRRAGEVFVLAGFLKILIVCFPFSTMAISMYFQGLCDLGYWAAIKMFPIAIAMLALAKAVVDRKLHERKFAPLAIISGGILALLLSRWAFARPRPSPLDPMLAHYHRARAAEAAASQNRERQAQAARRKSLQPDERIRVRANKLRDDGSTGRFSSSGK